MRKASLTFIMIAMSNTPLEQGIYKLSMMVGHKYSYQTG
jgi:hypothetical protein